MRLYPADPPRRRVREVTIMATSGALSEGFAKGGAQREERDGPAQLVRRSRRQRKPLPRRHIGGVAEQPGFAYARFPLHQHHSASPSLSAPQQVTDYFLLPLTSAHSLIADRSHRWR
jgi:hypothetical protein